MKKAIITIVILLLSASSEAQWHQIAAFNTTDQLGNQVDELIGMIYFMDLPGPPRIGFQGCNAELWKTTDGGVTWYKSWDPAKYGPSPGFIDMCFMDSLNGWLSTGTSKGYPVCWRTTDAGDTWNPQYAHFNNYSSNNIGNTINYFSSTRRLFLTLNQSDDTVQIAGTYKPYGMGRLVVSLDSGNIWQIVPGFDSVVHIYDSYLNDTQMYYYRGFGSMSLWSDSQAIVSSFSFKTYADDKGYTPDYYFRTTDGGLTWVQAGILPNEGSLDYWDGSSPPLAIPGTTTCFATTSDLGTRIYRSDDYGQTWRKIFEFPYNDTLDIGPSGDSKIYGDLNHLIINTDSSIFLSTDEGMTWVNGGITYDSDKEWLNDTTPYYYPYAAIYNGVYANGKIFAGKTDEYDGVTFSEGLWEEDWPQASGVAEQEDSILSNATANPNPTGIGTVISFGISKEAYVKIDLFDLLGQGVSSVHFESLFAPGNKSVPISLMGLPSGTYYARIMTAYGEVQTVKLVKE